MRTDFGPLRQSDLVPVRRLKTVAADIFLSRELSYSARHFGEKFLTIIAAEREFRAIDEEHNMVAVE